MHRVEEDGLSVSDDLEDEMVYLPVFAYLIEWADHRDGWFNSDSTHHIRAERN